MPAESSPAPEIFEAHIAREGETSTLVLEGEFDLSAVDVVRAKFAEACGEAPSRIVIDLSELTFIDSTGISFLLAAAKEDEGNRLSFIASSAPAVQRVFAITGVGGLFGGEAKPLSRA